MTKKLILLVLLFLTVFTYQDVDGILTLTSSDFPSVLSEFKYIFVEFSMARGPGSKDIELIDIYSGIKHYNPDAKLGKINVMEHKDVMDQYKTYAFPTYILFKNGEQIRYNGQQKLEEVVNWLRKRITSPVIQIDKKKYDKLYFETTASIVYHGDLPSSPDFQALNQRSLKNIENSFYWGKDLGSKEGTIQMLKNSSAMAYIGKVNQDFDVWLFKYRKGLIWHFTIDVSSYIFGDEQIKGFVLFNNNKEHILKQMTEAAKAYNKADVVFATIEPDSSQEKRMKSIFNIDPEEYPLVLYEYKTRSKYLLKEPFTKKTILAFLNNPTPFKFSLEKNVTLLTQQKARQEQIQQAKQRQIKKKQAEQKAKQHKEKIQKQKLQKQKLQKQKAEKEQGQKKEEDKVPQNSQVQEVKQQQIQEQL